MDLLRRSPGGDLTPLLEDPGRRRMLGSFPMPRLAAMLGPTLGDELGRALAATLDG